MKKQKQGLGQFTWQLTEKGFKFGPAEIERIDTDPYDITGGVTLILKTEDIDLEIYVTPAGMVRMYVPKGQMIMVQGGK